MEKPLTLRDANNPVIFVNQVAGAGFLNDNVNLTFSTLYFTPTGEQGGEVDLDPVITCRLRMDVACAQRLYEQLGQTLGLVRQARTPVVPDEASSHVGKLN